MNKISGIYKIINKITQDIYIGQTSNLIQRKNQHFTKLTKNKHYNKYLQHSFNKYGRSNFEFEILLFCEFWELDRYEQWFVDIYNPEYNILKICVTSPKGIERTEEFKQKISLVTTGSCNPMYGVYRSGSCNPNFGKLGKKRSTETKQKICLTLVHTSGSSHFMFGRSGSSTPMYNVHRYGKDAPNFGKLGKKRLLETKQKMSISQKERRLREKQKQQTLAEGSINNISI